MSGREDVVILNGDANGKKYYSAFKSVATDGRHFALAPTAMERFRSACNFYPLRPTACAPDLYPIENIRDYVSHKIKEAGRLRTSKAQKKYCARPGILSHVSLYQHGSLIPILHSFFFQFSCYFAC
uniref:Uncharacterized protein n=1 Tax=Schistocephalus solidus TaxID=70667 RepID=A0A0X3NXZ8_SCHSO